MHIERFPGITKRSANVELCVSSRGWFSGGRDLGHGGLQSRVLTSIDATDRQRLLRGPRPISVPKGDTLVLKTRVETKPSVLERANECRVALATAATQSCSSQPATAATKFVDQCQNDPGSRHSDGVTECDRATVHVDDVIGDP